MKYILPLTLSLFLALPAAAQDDSTDTPSFRDGLGLLSEGSRMILEGLMNDMAPFVEDHMIPLLQDLGGMIDDMSAYHAPEILPNGDIIIRRRIPLEEDVDESPIEEPIEL